MALTTADKYTDRRTELNLVGPAPFILPQSSRDAKKAQLHGKNGGEGFFSLDVFP